MTTGQSRVGALDIARLLAPGRLSPTVPGSGLANASGDISRALMMAMERRRERKEAEEVQAARSKTFGEIAAALQGRRPQVASTEAGPAGIGAAPRATGATVTGDGRQAIIRALMTSDDPALQELGARSALAAAPARETAKDVAGMLRYQDTGERVFPGVEKPRESKLLTPEEEAQRLRMAAAGRPSIQVNTGDTGVNYGDPPKDMAWARNPDGSVLTRQVELPGGGQARSPVAVPIAGGPVEAEQAEAAAAAGERAKQEEQSRDIVVQDIDRILSMTGEEEGLPVTGIAGATLSQVPGTRQRDVAALLDTIRSNVGFDKLQQMRNASPTGGALGQVSERENVLLQSTLGSLEQSQSTEQFERNLRRLRDVYLDVVHGPSGRFKDMPQEQLNNLNVSALNDRAVQQYNAEMVKRGIAAGDRRKRRGPTRLKFDAQGNLIE